MVIDVSGLFSALQQQMYLKMKQQCTHSPAKGDLTEEAWRVFFNEYLPKRYSCNKAFVVDYNGSISDQIDIVIYDEYFSPFIFNQDGVKYIPIESVYAVFEVKQSLSQENFEYAQQKAQSVRQLRRTTAPVYCNGTLMPGREPPHIIAGLLTTNKAWEDRLIQKKCSYDALDFLDIGCCVKGKSWLWHENNYILSLDEKDSLLSFFMAFVDRLRLLGTVPAMDISKYFKGF
ncbi:MAG: hypothetical protein IJ752_07005 [Alphaproteobacteria bacterium]|nr:hypothetical protein [Alphaproteobacteria bacterium]